MPDPVPPPPLDFVREIVQQDCASGKYQGRVHTRFPPEPNGYLHIGHAKSICLNFGIAELFGGKCNLRMDDTNPTTEDPEYVAAIADDVRWLGFHWHGEVLYASDYFEELYAAAVKLIERGKAFVCDLQAEQMAAWRGTLTTPGQDSPHRNRSVQENLDRFRRMRAGEFPDGFCTLRAKIDMAHKNLNLRDPVLYRIRREKHYRTGDRWCIYPMYDYAHPISDSIEGITHSLCTLEFEDHRPLYDWCLVETGMYRPQQIEFARLNLDYTALSKRKLIELVEGGHVDGWDDPRLPTIRGLRRRGCTPSAIKAFCDHIGISKYNSVHELHLLEHFVRKDLETKANRALAVLRPLKVVIENWPAGHVDWLEAQNHPDDPARGTRQLPFTGELWIEQDDFLENPPKDFFRLAPGREVRLRYAYFLKCTGVHKDAAGKVTEVRCTYDPATRGGNAPDGRKVKATIHWVSAAHAHQAEVRLYDTLFAHPEIGEDWQRDLNPRSLEVLTQCMLEPALAGAKPGAPWQFERLGFFCVDARDPRVWNRTVSLKDAWAKAKKKA